MVSCGRVVGAQVSYVGCVLVFVAEEASVVVGESEANKRKNIMSIELARVLPSYVGDNHVIGVVMPVCVRAEALARVCWQRVEQR